MTGRERMLAALNWEKPDRLPVYEHLWSETVERWQQEGLPPGTDPGEFFDWDMCLAGWFDLSLQLPVKQVEDDGTYITEWDPNGVLLMRHKHESGHTPHWLQHTLNTREDWEAYKHRLVLNAQRVDPGVIEQTKARHAQGRFVCLAGTEPYEAFWPAFGQVNIFQLMLDDPDLLADVFNTTADLLIEIMQAYEAQGAQFDGVWFYGDMGYRNGTLFSPECYDAMLAGPHRRLCEYIHSRGKQVILHSCGRIKSFLPRLIDAGFDAIQPLEAKCEQDVRELREQLGRKIVLFGNMDVRALAAGPQAIDAEVLPKLEAVAHEGGYIFHSDHSIPPDVSLENYQYALQLVRAFRP